MAYEIRDAGDEDAPAILTVFNHHVQTTFSAYPSVESGPEFYPRVRALLGGYPLLVVSEGERVVGFAMLKPYHPAETLRRTGELTYFLMPEHTGRGLGTRLLAELTSWAVGNGIDTLVANISSENEQSLAFHRARGFVECGRIRFAGHKFGRDFDVVWMQRMLHD